MRRALEDGPHRVDMHIDATHITYRYRGGDTALLDANLRVSSGRIVGLLGPNGSGKTTLLELLSRQRRMQEGSVAVSDAGRSIADVRMGWASSSPLLYDNVPLARFVERTLGPALGLTREASRERASALAERLDMARYYGRRPREYSQGTRMKASIILALLERPDVVILDEPFNGLDVHTVDVVASLAAEEKGAGCAILVADHQVGVLEEFVDDVAFLHKGVIQPMQSAAALVSRHGTLKDAYRAAIPS